MTSQTTRRGFLGTIGAGVIQAQALAQSQRKPNIIFIYADDLGIGDVGCYGADKYKTPHNRAV